MANWNLPTITSNYLDFVSEINGKFTDAALMFGFGGPSNIPVNTLRFNRSANLFDEWDGATFNPKILSVAGGGTGSNNVSGIRTNLGLGSMSTQNSNAVNITGGSITGVAYSASDITTGIMPLARGGTGSALGGTVFGDVLLWNGAQIVLASGANIRSFNANYLTEGTVPAARLSGVPLLSGNNGWAGSNTFNPITTFNDSINVVGGYPGFYVTNTTGAVNKHRLYFFNYLGDFYIQAQNDDASFAANLLRVGADGHLYAGGQGLTLLNASFLATGIVAPARLGSGPADSTTFLRGDNVWAIPAGSGGGGAPIPFPSGMISMFANGCPAGWTRVAAFDNRFPMGAGSYGQQGGNTRHGHSFSVNTNTDGNHSHSFSAGVTGRARGYTSGTTGASNQQETADGGSARVLAPQNHNHDFNVWTDLGIQEGNTSGETSLAGNHYHQVSGNTTDADLYPPYTTVFFCQKD